MKRVDVRACFPEWQYGYEPAKLFPGEFPWLTRPLYWVIRKLGGDFKQPKNEIIYHQVELDPEKLAKLIYDSQDAVYRIWHQDLRYVLVGQDLYTKFCTGLGDAFGTVLLSRKFAKDGTYRELLNGLHVILVPWMKGMVVLPEILGRDLA